MTPLPTPQEAEFSCDPRPAHIPEVEWEKADAEYLERREERDRQRLAEIALWEQAVATRSGWML